VFIQKSKKVGGARNDGILKAKGNIVATTDADCVVQPDWIETIIKDFSTRPIVQLYGLVYPLEGGIKNILSLAIANMFSRLGYYTRTFYYTLGCNTAFDKKTFIDAGMYRCIDAGDDLEIAQKMRKLGRVMLDGSLRVGFSMRRYQQFGMFKSLYEWLYIVLNGGTSDKYRYSKRNYD
jgi:glycosyltransferase involved in cell wall biosynthesis